MKPSTTRRGLTTLAAILIAFPAALPAEHDNSSEHTAAGRIAYHYVGRVSLNFLNGTGIVYGYLTDLAGVTSAASLFQGTPGETTALLTFRANINFQPLPGNGPIGNGQFAVTPVLVTPGNFQIYFTPSQSHDWTDPNTFSSGQVIATLARGLEQFSVLATFSSNAGSAASQIKHAVLPGWPPHKPARHFSQRRNKHHYWTRHRASSEHAHCPHLRVRRLRSHHWRLIGLGKPVCFSGEC